MAHTTDPRLKHAEYHHLGSAYVHRMPWSNGLWEELEKLQAMGVHCPSCSATIGHLPSCNIWCNVEDSKENIGEIEQLLGTDGPSKPSEENLTKWAEGRFSAADREMILQDEAICHEISKAVVTEAVAEQCRKELREAAQRGYKENKE